MENNKAVKNNEKKIDQTNDDIGSLISRRQFSVGLPGLLLAGTILESPMYDTSSTLAARDSILSTQSDLRRLTPHAPNQPHYILPGTTASAWSPDSQHIATFQENTVTLHDASTGKSTLSYGKHTDEVLTVKWSADSNYLASGGFDHTVHVWDAATGQTMIIYQGHTDIVRDIVWSPNQHYLASAGYDKTIQVWEALTGMMVVTYCGHTAAIQTILWSPDSRLIASTDLQNKTMVWRVM